MKNIYALIFVVFLNSPLCAVQVFDGGDPGYHPTGGYTPGANVTNGTMAADFQLSTPATVTDITFWTIEHEPRDEFDGGVKWYFLENNFNDPWPVSFAKGTGIVRNRTEMATGFQYDVSLDHPVALQAGTTYWLALKLQNSTYPANIYWVAPVGWLDPPAYSTYFGQTGRRSNTIAEPFNWGGQYFDLAFKLYDNSAVPEPASWLLTLWGVPALLRRRRQRKAMTYRNNP
jgi:hypothetical protein